MENPPAFGLFDCLIGLPERHRIGMLTLLQPDGINHLAKQIFKVIQPRLEMEGHKAKGIDLTGLFDWITLVIVDRLYATTGVVQFFATVIGVIYLFFIDVLLQIVRHQQFHTDAEGILRFLTF